MHYTTATSRAPSAPRAQESSKLNHALALAELGFHVFPLVEDTKLPEISGWPRRATRDAKQIERWWTCPVFESERNLNIGMLGGRFADGHLVAVDLDRKRGKDGVATFEALAAECGGQIPETLTTTTPTGGRHLFFTVPEPVASSAGTLGEGIDVRGNGGFVVAPGSTLSGRVYAFEDPGAQIAACPEWLLGKLKRSKSNTVRSRPPVEFDPEQAAQKAQHYLAEVAPLAIEGAGGDHTTIRVASQVLEWVGEVTTAHDLMLDHWNDRCSPPWDPADLLVKVRNAHSYMRNPPGGANPEAQFEPVDPTLINERSEVSNKAADTAVVQLNKQYAMAWAGGRVVIIKEGTQPPAGPGAEPVPVVEFVRPQDFRTWHLNDTVKIVRGGKISQVPVSKLWETSPKRRQYSAIDFCPEGAPSDVYNLWRGFTVEADPGASCQRLLDHVLANICSGDESLFRWVMGWFAHLIQRPAEKSETALVLLGGQGAGKTIVGKAIGALLGPHHVLVSSSRFVTGQFNAHLKQCLLLQADEAFWAGDKQAEGALKDLITGTVQMVEHKGVDPIPMRNLVRLFATTNHDWAVPAGMDERRFAVIRVSNARARDHQYFGAIQRELDSGGLGGLLHYLQTFDLDAVNLREIPKTRALLEQKMQSLPAIEAWWLDALAAGQLVEWEGWPQEVDRQHLFNQFRQYAKTRGVRHQDSDQWIGKKLRDFLPGTVRSVKRRDGTGRRWTYKMPPLAECRDYFSEKMGGGIEWEDPED